MSAYHFSPYVIPAAVTAAVVMLSAIVIVLTRFSRASASMFSMAFAAAAWQVACAFMYLSVDARTALMWAKIGCAFVPFLAAAAYQFVDSIVPTANHRRIISAIGWFAAAQFAIVTLTTEHLVGGVRRYSWGFYPTCSVAARVLYPLFFGVLLAAAIVDIVRAYPNVTETERNRIRIAVIALGI